METEPLTSVGGFYYVYTTVPQSLFADEYRQTARAVKEKT